MKTLIQGCESAQQIEILLKLTGISSDNLKNALRAYLVEGFPATHGRGKHGACISFGIGNQDGHTPRFKRQDNVFALPDVILAFRHLDELWENIHERLATYHASLDIRKYRLNA